MEEDVPERTEDLDMVFFQNQETDYSGRWLLTSFEEKVTQD